MKNMETMATIGQENPDYVVLAEAREVKHVIDVYADRLALCLEQSKRAELVMLNKLHKLAPHLNLATRVYSFSEEGSRIIAHDRGPRVKPLTLVDDRLEHVPE